MKDLEPYIIGLIILLSIVAIGLWNNSTKDPHNCNAPCNVHFKEPVMEDDVFWHWNTGNYAVVYKGKH